MATGRLPDPNTAPVTAKGDLYTYSTVPAKLAVGNNGETLVADSSASQGLRYNPLFSQNLVVNGSLDFWQRGTSFVDIAGNYTADRWQGFRSGSASGGTWSRQTGAPDQFDYCLRVARNSGNTATNNLYAATSFESSQVKNLRGQYLTLSFWARKGANFSAASDALDATILSGTGTDGNVYAGFTGQAAFKSQTLTLTTSWQRFTITSDATLGTTISQLGLRISYLPSGTAGAADYFEIAGVQLELGQTATTWKRAGGGTLAGELAACQRYYWRTSNIDAFGTMGTGVVDTTTNAQIYYPLKVTMRVKPTSVDFSTLRIFDGAASYAVTAVAINTNHNGSDYAAINCTSSGMTAGRIPAILQGNGSTSAFLGFSAEL